MKQKKIRGHNRRYKTIERWRLNNLSFDLSSYFSSGNDRCYAKIRVHPWSGISMVDSAYREPARKTKVKMLNALVDIYEAWKNQLDAIGQPYYLKIWLFEPRFSMSQVVCATGDSINFYDNVFFKPFENKELRYEEYGEVKSRFQSMSFEYRLDEEHYDNCEVGEPELYASKEEFYDMQNWFYKLLKKPHRTVRFEKPIDGRVESYSFRRGDVWLGG